MVLSFSYQLVEVFLYSKDIDSSSIIDDFLMKHECDTRGDGDLGSRWAMGEDGGGGTQRAGCLWRNWM